MITWTLSRRLAQLEQERPSPDVVKVWQIVTIDSAGNVEHAGINFRACQRTGFVRPSVSRKHVADNA